MPHAEHEDGRAVQTQQVVYRREAPDRVGSGHVRSLASGAKTGKPVTLRSVCSAVCEEEPDHGAPPPWLYFEGVLSGEMGEALKVLVVRRQRACHSQHRYRGTEARGVGTGILHWWRAQNDWMRRTSLGLYLGGRQFYSGLESGAGEIVSLADHWGPMSV